MTRIKVLHDMITNEGCENIKIYILRTCHFPGNPLTRVPTEVYMQYSVKGLPGMLKLNDFPYILWYFSTHGTKILYHQSGIGPPLGIIVHMGTIILLPKKEGVPPLSIIVHMGTIILLPKIMTPPRY